MRWQLPALGLTALAMGAACTSFDPEAYLPGDADAWWSNLEPSSPCYDVDLMDGLAEDDTAEFQSLFACLNHYGHLDPLVPTSRALLAPEAAPVGLDLAVLVNRLPESGVDVWALGGVAVDALRAEDQPLDQVLDLLLELTYGQPAHRVRSGEVILTSSYDLEHGVLAPASPLVVDLATAALDDDLQATAAVGELLTSPSAVRWLETVDAWVTSDNPAVRDPMQRLLPDTASALRATRSPGNDLWTRGSGDSLRDLVEIATSGPVQAMSPELAELFSDGYVQVQLPDTLVDLYGEGHLHHAAAEVGWLASVDIDGRPLSRGQTSGLHALLRLLHDANQPMDCSLDLWVTDLDIHMGNLSVSILGFLADQDPSTVQSGVGILGSVMGWGLSEWTLEEIADSGVCPALTPQVVADVQAVDLFYEPESEHLLHTLLRVLHVLKYADEDQIPTLVDLASDLHASGLSDPAGELLRDVGEEALVTDAVDLVPVLAEPWRYGLGSDVADMDEVVDAVLWLTSAESGPTGWERLHPLVRTAATHDVAWGTVDRVLPLLEDDTTQTAHALELVHPILALDPDRVLLAQVAPLVAEEQLTRPLLTLVASPVTGHLLATSPRGDDPEVPLAFTSRLITDGTLDDVLALVDLLLTELNALAVSE